MDNFRTSADLKEGAIVNIYTDYKFQTQFEGTAKLVKRQKKGLTFMICDENLLTLLENRVIDEEKGCHLPLTKKQRENNQLFAKLTMQLVGYKRSGVLHVNTHLHGLYLELKKKVNKNLNNPEVLDKILNRYRMEWLLWSDERGGFFALFPDNEIIIKFIQQTCIDKWCHSMWREEFWLVDFVSDDPFFVPFRTVRKIRTLICISPDEDSQNSEILYYATKDNSEVSNFDKKEDRLRKKKLGKLTKLKIVNEDDEVDSLYTADELEFIAEDDDTEFSDDLIISTKQLTRSPWLSFDELNEDEGEEDEDDYDDI